MGKDTKNISRLELFKRVWETPVTQLAKECGLSDVGFAKICKKYNIPRPPRGYWAKKAAGQSLPKEPLPRRPSEEIIEISPNLSNQLNPTENSKLLQHIGREQNFPPIVVAKSLRNPHPFVDKSTEILELCRPNDVGILEPTDKKCLDIRVSKNNLRRALRIMDTLIKGLLQRGFEVYQGDDSYEVKIDGECLGFGISEEVITTKTQPKDTNLEGYYQFGHSRFDRVRAPSGKLCLTIHDRSYFWSDSFRKNWRDTKRKQLEDSLDAFVIGLIKRAAQKKEYRRQKAEEERQRQEMARLREQERQCQAELNRKIQEEKARVSKLVTDAENYNKSKQIREFITAVENEHQKGNFVYVTDDDYENWVKWAQDQANRLDPLVDSPPSIFDQAAELDNEQLAENKGFESHYKKW
jgi:hypothetical protein